MGRRAWAWGAGLFVLGVVVLAASLHAVITFRPAAGSQQTATLGQLLGLLAGGVVLVAGSLVLVTGLRRRLAARRRRRLLRRLAERDDPAG